MKVHTSSTSNEANGRTLYIGAFPIDGQVDLAEVSSIFGKPRIDLPKGFEKLEQSSMTLTFDSSTVQQEGTTRVEYADILYKTAIRNPIPATLFVSRFGVGYVVVRRDSNYEETLLNELEEQIKGSIETFAKWVPKAFPEVFKPEYPAYLLEGPGEVLWWHRLLTDQDPYIVDRDFWGVVPISSSVDSTITVGVLFTVVPLSLALEPEQLDQVVRGILAATDDWLVADSTNRELRNFLQAATATIATNNGNKLNDINVTGEALVRKGQFLRLQLDARDRYLVRLRGSVWSAARKAWGLEGEMSSLETKISVVHGQTRATGDRLQRRQDDFRNHVLFAIALLAALQSSLIVIDFAVHPEFFVQHPLRAIIAGLILLLSLGVGAGLALYWYKQRRRR